MTRPVRVALLAGSAYIALFLALTGAMPGPASAGARLVAGHLLLLVPSLAAVLLAARAARASLGAERAFWTLLAAAAAAQTAAEVAFLSQTLLSPAPRALLGLGHGGHYAFSVFVAVSVLVSPHRPLGGVRLRWATVEWTMAAAVVYFLALYFFLAVPLTEAAYPWFGTLTVQQVVPAVGFAVLAWRVRVPPFATVYRILAGGLGAAALAGIAPNWRYATTPDDPWSPAGVDWVITLVTLAVAAVADRGPAWVPGHEEAEAAPRRGWAMAAAVMLPLGVDLAMRASGARPALADDRSLVALAVTGVLLTLMAVRVRRTPAPATATPPPSPSSLEESSEYVHFATGVAHELNNPLMAVRVWAELALRTCEPRESLEALLAATSRATQAVRRLQQLGRAVEASPPEVPTPARTEPAEAGDVEEEPKPAGAPSLTRVALGTAVFGAVYYVFCRAGASTGATDALLVIPAAVTTAVLWRRARASRSRRQAWFWGLLAAGPALWTAAETVWSVLELGGRVPMMAAGRLLDALFLAFLVPIVAALGVRPHPRVVRKDPVAVPDVVLIAVGVLYAFVRLAVVSALPMGEPMATKRILFLGLCAVAGVWAAALWRTVDHPGWRRAYGAVSIFALAYGMLGSVANGLDGTLLEPGGWPDIAWFVPFAILACAVGAGRSGAVDAFPALLAAGAGPIVLELVLRDRLPTGPAAVVTTACAVLLAAAAAVRLRWQTDVDRRERRRARLAAEESARAGRLTALASLVAAAVGQLEDELEDVVHRARAASVVVPDKGAPMLGQARRARDIVRELQNAFRLVPSGPRHDLDVAALVEEVVESALDEGLPLHVSLEEMARLPRVQGDPRALSAALAHLLRNAAQASPGGVLRIRGAQREGSVELRFADDGPGVPPALRADIFDPFFTTRRVGEGVGLGLTLVHFVARGHGGSVVLEDGSSGACFVLRLPARPAAGEAGARTPWSFAAAALAAGVAAIVMAIEPAPLGRATWSVGFQIASALAATAAGAWAAVRHRGSRRAFWAWMAAGAGIWALTRILRVLEGGVTGRPSAGIWPLVLYSLADLSWAAALLLRPDRRRDLPSSRLALSTGVVLCLFAYALAELVVLPDFFSLTDPALRQQLVIVRGMQKVALCIWAGALAWRALVPYWRGFYARLSAVFATWAVGQTVAFSQRSRPDYAAGGASDLGWIVPFLCLAAFALHESAPLEAAEDAPAVPDRLRPMGSAAWLLAVAAIVAADAVFGSASASPALAAARAHLTQVMVVVMALLLAGRELLAAREGQAAAGRRFPREASPSRWTRRMGSAVHELGSHLSSINALSRLLLSQSDASTRARADTRRLQDRAEAATRVVRNLLAALPSSVGGRDRLSPNRVVEDAVDARRAALEADGIGVRCTLAPRVPALPIDAAALRHVVVALLDRAGVAVRGRASPGQIEVTTALRAGAVLVTVGDDGVSAPGPVLDRLMDAVLGAPAPPVDSDLERSLVRESIEREGGSLAVGHRPGGGTEFVVRLPIPESLLRAEEAEDSPAPRRKSGTS